MPAWMQGAELVLFGGRLLLDLEKRATVDMGSLALTEMGRSLTTRWSGPGIQRQRQEVIKMGQPEEACEGAIAGRSLVPAAQAQAARSR
jgi:hypothetical protein